MATGDRQSKLSSWAVRPPPPYEGAHGIWSRELLDGRGRQHFCMVTDTPDGICASLYRTKTRPPYGFSDVPAWDRCGFRSVYEARKACDRRFRALMRR